MIILMAEEVSDPIIYRLAVSQILTDVLGDVMSISHVLARSTELDWTEVLMKYENTEFGKVPRRLYETGERSKAAALILARELNERYINPIKAQLGSVREELGSKGSMRSTRKLKKELDKLENKLRELVEFVTRVMASEFPLPKDVVPEHVMYSKYEVVGDYVVVEEPFDLGLRLDLQLPKEVLDDEELPKIAALWVVHHYADRFYAWLMMKPGDAILYNSIYFTGWVPGAVVLSALYGLGIDPNQLNWEGLINELNRLDEEISRVKAQLRETEDKGEKAKLKEELERLKDEREGLLDALITWADAIKTLKLALQKEEWKIAYNSLPELLRNLIGKARDPRDSFEIFLKKDGLKILGVVDKERRRAGKDWVSVDDVGEARERLRKYIPMLDKLIEPVMTELINEVNTATDAILNRLGMALDEGLLVNARQSAESARNTLEQALDRLRSGDLDNAINAIKVSIEDLRDVAIKEYGEWVDELVSAVGILNEEINQLAVLNALNKLVK
jgi:tetratricopeptide (TPR) repeat protein